MSNPPHPCVTLGASSRCKSLGGNKTGNLHGNKSSTAGQVWQVCFWSYLKFTAIALRLTTKKCIENMWSYKHPETTTKLSINSVHCIKIDPPYFPCLLPYNQPVRPSSWMCLGTDAVAFQSHLFATSRSRARQKLRMHSSCFEDFDVLWFIYIHLMLYGFELFWMCCSTISYHCFPQKAMICCVFCP